MNAKQLKNTIKITDFLGLNNILKNKDKNKSEFFVLSPFRKEKTPSFKINKAINTWFDFGEGCGGSIIDLVCKLNNCDVKQAIKLLNKYVVGKYVPDFSFSKAKIKVKKDTKIEIIKVDELQNEKLINYVCSERKINYKFAKKYLKQVTYAVNSNIYKAVGFKNDLNGYELRSKKFKGSIISKAVTTINKNSNKVAVFEGMFDFLSALTYYNRDVTKSNIIVLNSLSMLKNLDLSEYAVINLFLDNDDAGRNAVKKIITDCKSVKIKDYSYIYAYSNCKDFNEFLQKAIEVI